MGMAREFRRGAGPIPEAWRRIGERTAPAERIISRVQFIVWRGEVGEVVNWYVRLGWRLGGGGGEANLDSIGALEIPEYGDDQVWGGSMRIDQDTSDGLSGCDV